MTLRDYLAPARARWGALSGREQALLVGLAALTTATALWFGVVAPAQSWRDEARRGYAGAVEEYERLLADIARHQALAAEVDQPGGATPLRTLVGRSAGDRGLAISRVQPLEDGRLGVWFDTVEADALLAWLVDLARTEGVRADRVSLDREGDERVRAQLLLSRAGGA